MRTACLTLGAALLTVQLVGAAEPVLPVAEYRTDSLGEQNSNSRATRPNHPADDRTGRGPAALLTPSRDLVLTLGLFGNDVCVDVWMSSDAGRSWRWTGQRPDSLGVARLRVESDGVYQFYVVATNAAGSSAADPAIGSAPHAIIEVDATPPTFQLLSASWAVAGGPLTLRAVLIDEHALPELRIFYREESRGAWRDGGTGRLSEGKLEWRPRATISSSRIDLRAVAADRAGNCVFDELTGIAVPTTPPQAPAGREPAAPDAIELAARVSRLERMAAAQTSANEGLAAPETTPASVSQALARHRALAAQFAEQGRFDLALARLDDALATQPEDADLLVAAGDACLQLGKLDSAEARFTAALRANPLSLDGRRGAARLAAARGRLADARRHLLQLLELAPQDAAAWLKLGDAEFQLGRSAAAAEDWRQAMALSRDEALREQARRRIRELVDR